MRASAVFFASVLSFGALVPLACTQDFGIFDPKVTSSSTGGGGDATTTTSISTGTGGTGGAAECMAGDPCSDQNQCTTDACDTTAGKCTHAPVTDGPDPMGADLSKDCLAPWCVGGVAKQVPQDTDIPEDGNPCTSDTCNNGVPMTVNLDTTTKCGASLYCDGKGACVGCVNDNQCSDPGECQYAKCENTQCVIHDTTSGNNCGGGNVCNGNGACVGCLNDTACTGSKICINESCATSCNTGMKDGKETDVDCGGPCMTKCTPGKGCKVNGDCTTNNCNGTTCLAAPTCTDTIKNGSETDVDCGGTCPMKCGVGLICGANGDCMSNMCVGNTCAAAAPTCTDSTMNGAETDKDCGGGTCGPCGDAKKCAVNTDCLSLSCVALACAPTACSNGVKDGSETSIDCGGSCTKCPNTKACMIAADCQSGNCMAGFCAP